MKTITFRVVPTVSNLDPLGAERQSHDLWALPSVLKLQVHLIHSRPSRRLKKTVTHLKHVKASSFIHSFLPTACICSAVSASRCADCQAHHFSSFSPNKWLTYGPNVFVPAAAFRTLDTAGFFIWFSMKRSAHVTLIYWRTAMMTTKKTFHCSVSADVSRSVTCKLVPNMQSLTAPAETWAHILTPKCFSTVNETSDIFVFQAIWLSVC